MKIVAKDRPRWYQFRWRVSNLLIAVARKIHPENPEVRAFWMQLMTDQLIYGKTVVRVDPTDQHRESGKIQEGV